MFYQILIAEDDPIQRRLVRRMLEADLAVEIIEAADGAEALQRLKHESGSEIALALIDLDMPVMGGMELLQAIQQAQLPVRTLVLTGSDRLEDAVEAMQFGALDFIPKPPQRERLITSVRNALAMRDLQEEVIRLQQDVHPIYQFETLLEISPGLKDAIALGKKAAGSDIAALVTGKSGVGKEVFARAIHTASKRSHKPLIAVNCGALPENLVESALFGHEKGAFTGAVSTRAGKFEEANNGTIFLDEVGELPLNTQVRLLRVLETGEFIKVG